MLNEFNQYTNGKYSEAIKKKILEDEFEILIIEKIKELTRTDIIKNYTSLGMKKKVKICIRWYLPNVYDKLGKIKRSIKAKL